MQSYAAMREEIEAEGGTVEKFIGDAVMAAFGVPAAHEDDRRARAPGGPSMLARLDELNGDLERCVRRLAADPRRRCNSRRGPRRDEPRAGRGDGDGRRGERGVAAPGGRRPGNDLRLPAHRRRRPRLLLRGSRAPRAEGQARSGAGRPSGGGDGHRIARRPGTVRADGRSRFGARPPQEHPRAGRPGAAPAPRHGVRRCRGREVSPDRGVPPMGGVDRPAADGPAGPVPPVRRRHHVLAPGRDPEGACGDPGFRSDRS